MSRLVAAPPPNRVRSPTDRQFASGCSPRRFEPTQLPLASELWHTPARTFTVLMWRPHRRTHSRMLLAGIQAESGTGPPIKTFGGDGLGSRISSPQPQFSKERRRDVLRKQNCRLNSPLKISLCLSSATLSDRLFMMASRAANHSWDVNILIFHNQQK